jgi:hypothetical protein
VPSVRGIVTAGAVVRLVRADGTGQAADTQAGRDGNFEFRDVPPGWVILSAVASGFHEIVRAIRVEAASTDAGDLRRMMLLVLARPAQEPVRILTVCEALDSRDAINRGRVVIVGIFKSGMDETLRLDCPSQLISGELGWPSSIGLTRPAQPPDELREEIEKKRAEVLKSGPPGAQPRPERVVALYGIFVSLAGLTSAPCCQAAVETAISPARLFGISERDFRVIR